MPPIFASFPSIQINPSLVKFLRSVCKTHRPKTMKKKSLSANPSTLIGLGIGALLLALCVGVYAPMPSHYLNLPGLAIVLGGTLAATFIAYPLREIQRILPLLRTVFSNERSTDQHDIDELVDVARLWMQDDVRKAEQALDTIANSFLRTGVQLVINQTPENQTIELLHWRIARLRAREHAQAQMFRVMAGFAPAFGMLGTVIGLINMMDLLKSGDMSMIGPQMAVALMTTLYGLLLANLAFKPVAIKLERRTDQRIVVMNMILQGISMMYQKRGPAVMRETLLSFLEQDDERQPPRGKPGKADTARTVRQAAARPVRPPLHGTHATTL